jgi:hypothetical protein
MLYKNSQSFLGGGEQYVALGIATPYPTPDALRPYGFLIF